MIHKAKQVKGYKHKVLKVWSRGLHDWGLSFTQTTCQVQNIIGVFFHYHNLL